MGKDKETNDIRCVCGEELNIETHCLCDEIVMLRSQAADLVRCLREDLQWSAARVAELEGQLDRIRKYAHVTVWPGGWEYPIEHNPDANKDMWDDVIAALAAKERA